MKYACLLGALGIMFVAGCDHKIQMTFNNTTSEVREVEVAVGDDAMHNVGTVRPGRTICEDFTFKKNELPNQISWQAGDASGAVKVTDKTKKVIVNIEPKGRSTTMGPKDEVHKHQEETTHTDESHTVIEP